MSQSESQPNVIELARTGDATAIATVLSAALGFPAQAVKVDWHGGHLNIRLISEQFADDSDKSQWMATVQQQMRWLDVNSVSLIKLYAYRPQQPAPVWGDVIDLTAGYSAFARTPDQMDTLLLSANTVDRFLVCGLGSLGQYCVLNLKRFAMGKAEIHVTAIDRVEPDEWEVQDLPNLLAAAPIIGDCRDDAVLLRGNIQQCRTVLIVTSNESVNVETAIAARRLNPTVRIIMRSSRHNLNQLLKQQLGDFVAFEPTELPAPAFALAGLQEGMLGVFNVGDYRFQVVEHTVLPRDRFDGFSAVSLHKRTYRLLSYAPAHSTEHLKRAFYQWKTDTKLQVGDRIAYVEMVGRSTDEAQPEDVPRWQQLWQGVKSTVGRGWQHNWRQFGQWLQAQRIRQVIAIGLGVALLLWAGGTLLLKSTLDLSWQLALSTAFILLLGGYGDVFGGLDPIDVPGWVQFLCGLISLASIASVLGVLGLITDNLLSSRFEFFKRRPTIPKQNHIVVVGFGRIGQRVAALLRELKQPIVVITERPEAAPLLPKVPVVMGDVITALPKVNLATAKSVIVLTDDQMLNLEVALMARSAAQQLNRSIDLVIRTYDQRFRDNLNTFLPDAKALAAYELAAEAFAGAAFGENILGLFRLNDQTILVTEYQITEGDTLIHKSLFQIAYGYGVIPIFHQRANQATEEHMESLLPTDERQLYEGDRLVVLSSINGLRRIEHGELVPPRRWRLNAQKPLNPTFLYYCGNDLARISGCGLEEARAFMNRLPGTIELWMYDYQAHQLVQELSRKLPMWWELVE
ncbi:potassium channel family protein [Thermocoleostomius sinensis]|uniref:NAD-binding protein n=1 Tax=Thermocoleostomius sinensis A174 TaxID=2016057 RepID=A0A9E9C968_9CYAN|nr:potassium channel protein [Thermocoleostomius sinensis]WAL59207.1 NAD-binding protein [Thermocoleostomius sinensis A174]